MIDMSNIEVNKKISKNVAIILAAGISSRLKGSKPKQFLRLGGKTLIEHTLRAFDINKDTYEIILVINEEYLEEANSHVLNSCINKKVHIVYGGNNRRESSFKALSFCKKFYSTEKVNVLIHDAARPLLSQQIINNVVKALTIYEAVDVAIDPVDTLIQVNKESGLIDRIPSRSDFMNGQTPQGFDLNLIYEAHEKSLLCANFEVSDDCGILKKMFPEVKIYVVYGSNKNMKVTYKEDLYILDKYLQINEAYSESFQDFSHLRDKTIVVFGGNSGIGEEICSQVKKYTRNVFALSRRNGCDVRNKENVQQKLADIFKETGSIDHVIVTAAVLNKNKITDLVNDDKDNHFSVNFTGSVNVSSAAYEYIIKSKGSIFLFASSSYSLGRGGYSMYGASKAALVNFVQAASEEWNGKVIINCINPERVKTPMRLDSFGSEKGVDMLLPSEVAYYTLGLLSTDLSGMVFSIKK